MVWSRATEMVCELALVSLGLSLVSLLFVTDGFTLTTSSLLRGRVFVSEYYPALGSGGGSLGDGDSSVSLRGW